MIVTYNVFSLQELKYMYKCVHSIRYQFNLKLSEAYLQSIPDSNLCLKESHGLKFWFCFFKHGVLKIPCTQNQNINRGYVPSYVQSDHYTSNDLLPLSAVQGQHSASPGP